MNAMGHALVRIGFMNFTVLVVVWAYDVTTGHVASAYGHWTWRPLGISLVILLLGSLAKALTKPDR